MTDHGHPPSVAAVPVELRSQFGIVVPVLGPRRPGPGDHDGVGAARGKGCHGFLLFCRRAAGSGEQDHLALLPGRVLHSAGDGGEVGVRDVMDDQPNEAGT
jgi:hypothetical protein